MIFNEFAYIAHPDEPTPEEMLAQNGRPKTLAHVRAVAQECQRIAALYGLDADKCRMAGLLHDVSAVIKAADMLSWAQRNSLPLCEAEERYPFLLHQRLSAVAAQQAFGVTDEDVLSAVACHTTLRAEASPYDMALFLADKIAWDQPGEPPYLERVLQALERSLEKACLVYMEYANDSLLCPHDNWVRALDWLKRKTL